MDSKQAAHDLTMLLLRDKGSDTTPESLAILYCQTYDKIFNACVQYNKEHMKKGKPLEREDW